MVFKAFGCGNNRNGGRRSFVCQMPYATPRKGQPPSHLRHCCSCAERSVPTSSVTHDSRLSFDGRPYARPDGDFIGPSGRREHQDRGRDRSLKGRMPARRGGTREGGVNMADRRGEQGATLTDYAKRLVQRTLCVPTHKMRE